jgi:hypothetical protein
MPPRGPAQSTTPPAAAASPAPAATNTPTAAPTPVRQQAAYPVKRSALPDNVGGIAFAPEPTGGGAFEKHPDLEAGEHTFSAYVDSIIMWPGGPSVNWKCHALVHADGTRTKSGVYGRDLQWAQTPSKGRGPGSKGFPYWRRDIVTCYRGVGLPDMPDAENPGWDKSKDGDIVPPYYSFFTDTIGRAIVPIMFRVTVKVRAGAEKYPDFIALAHEQVGDSYVLAPTPQKLPDWVASMHGWVGTPGVVSIKSQGIEIPTLIDISGINAPAGMPTWRDL